MKSAFLSWQLWAVLSACFAALTAIFAKIGVENVNSDFATFIRTIVILCALARNPRRHRPMAVARFGFGAKLLVPRPLGTCHGRFMGMLFSRPQVGRRGPRRPDRQAQRRLVAVFGVVFLGERLSIPNWLGVALIAAGAVLVAYKS